MANDKDFVVKNAVEVGGSTKTTLGSITENVANQGYYITDASYDSKSFSVASQETAPSGVSFKTDGTKMYVIGAGSDTVFQYSLSTAWDVSTASYDSVSFSVASQETAPQELFIKPDGTKLYVVGSVNDTVYQYSLSTAWDMSSASYDSVSFSVASQDTTPVGLFFKSDGTKMYVSGNANDGIFQYSLSTAWNVSTASYDSVSLDVSTQVSVPNQSVFSDDGTKVFVADGAITYSVYQYNLTTAWDLSTGSYANVSFDLSAQGESPRALFFSSDGTKMYTAGTTNDTVYQYSTASYADQINLDTGNYFSDTLAANTTYTISNAGDVQSFQLEVTGGGSPYNITNAGLTGSSFSFSSQIQYVLGCAFGDSGTKLYAFQNSSNIYQYTLTTAYDLSTASYASKSFNIATQDTNMRSIVWKNDGTAFFTLGATNDYVYKYTCSTAWDISTASYIHASSSLGSDPSWTTPLGLEMSSDGTKFFITNANGGTSSTRFEQWTMTTAYDLTTASQTDTFDLVNSEYLADGLSFNNDGTELFVVEYNTDKVWKYSLSTAYDLTTVSYSGESLDVSAVGNTPTEIMFNDDGSKMYIAKYDSPGTLYEYNSQPASTLTWPTSIEWAGGVAPAAPATGETDLFSISTDDGGTTYQGFKTADNLS